jgi:hypothetical protein
MAVRIGRRFWEVRAMPFYGKGDVRIHYEVAGSGFPLLLVPGGALNSVFAHPAPGSNPAGCLADITNWTVSRTEARFALAVLTTERKAA